MAGVPGRSEAAAQWLPAVVGAAVVSAGLQFAGPVLGGGAALLSLFVPVPVAWALLRFGSRAGICALLLTFCTVLVLGGPDGLIEYLLQYGLLTIVPAWCMRREIAWDRAALAGVISVLVLIVVYSAAVAQQSGQTMLQQADAYVASAVEQGRSMIDTSQFTAEQRTELETKMTAFLANTFVGLGIASVAAMALLLVLCLSKLLSGTFRLPGPAFIDWRAPEGLVWLLIVAGFLLVFFSGGAVVVGLNLLVVLGLIYYLQGLAVATHFFVVRKMPLLLRTLGYFMMLFASPMQLLVAGVGLFDLWIDFRSKYIKEET